MSTTPLAEAVTELAGVLHEASDNVLDYPWAWGPYDEGVRFGLLRTAEDLRQLAALTDAARVRANDPVTEAQRILGQHHRGFRQLEAIVLGLDDQTADRAPAPGEWSVREAVAHVARTESGFRVAVTHALRCHRAGVEAGEIPESAWAEILQRPFDEFDAIIEGPLSGLLPFLAEAEARVLSDFAGVTDDELQLTAHFWEPTPMPIRFRLHRFDSHIRQHSVQMEKCLDSLGRPPTEARRLLRLVYDALGEAEAASLGARSQHEGETSAVATTVRARTAELAAAVAAGAS